jgi:hypothetical protein
MQRSSRGLEVGSGRQASVGRWTACAIALLVAMTMACSSKRSNASLPGSPSPPAAATAASQAPSAVPPAVQAVADRLVARDVDGVMRSVELVPRGCATQSSGPGTPPICAPGQAAGSPIPAFVTSTCEGSYVTLLETVRVRVESVLDLRRGYPADRGSPSLARSVRSAVDGLHQVLR